MNEQVEGNLTSNFKVICQGQAKKKKCGVSGNSTDSNFWPDPKVFIKIFLFSTNPALCYLYVRQDWVIRFVLWTVDSTT